MGRLATEHKNTAVDAAATVEDLVGELAADQAVLRITLQNFLLRLFATRPDAGAAGLIDLKEQVLRTITQMPVGSSRAIDDEHWRQLMAIRAERLFDEIESAFSSTSAESDIPH